MKPSLRKEKTTEDGGEYDPENHEVQVQHIIEEKKKSDDVPKNSDIINFMKKLKVLSQCSKDEEQATVNAEEKRGNIHDRYENMSLEETEDLILFLCTRKKRKQEDQMRAAEESRELIQELDDIEENIKKFVEKRRSMRIQMTEQ